MSGRIAAAIAAVLMLSACRTPIERLAFADQAVAEGGTAHAVRLTELALSDLDVRDPGRWDRLGENASDLDDDVADRAFERAELLLWTSAGPHNSTRLSLPFAGRWHVTQGNRGEYSHRRLADRFAWDFQKVDADGDASRDGSETPSSFFGFGAPVFAPADGVVARVENDVRDNTDGKRNYDQAGGNVVVIRHASGEMSHFCHLQHGSVVVRVGQAVRRGEMVGRCGCSGNAVEPHLHYVLRVGPTSDDYSVPARFEGASILRHASGPRDGVPREGDIVETAAPR